MGARDIICLSLDAWDEVWRRNQFFADEILKARPSARILFVQLPVDVTWALAHREKPASADLRPVGDSGRLWVLTPRKWLPRLVWPYVDRSLEQQVLSAAARLGLDQPLLWINDNTYAGLLETTGWAAVYDITDDWLLGTYPPREITRQRRHDATLLRNATAVVVCSPALERSRGQDRPVHLVPNGVDVDHFRRMQDRPEDLPDGPVVLYVGTLSDGRLDVDLTAEMSRRLHGEATVVLVGPNCMSAGATQRLVDAGALILGARPYGRVPGYLQHSDVLIVPHVVSPFTESLDPIKARELLAVGRPTVSTPVAGFRELGPPVVVAAADRFADEVTTLLADGPATAGPGSMAERPVTWAERAREFLSVLDESAEASQERPDPTEAAGIAQVGPVSAPLEVVVVAYGDPDTLNRSLTALAGAQQVLVVDNSSDPKNRDVTLGHDGRYIDASRNLGFAGAVNRALAARSVPWGDVLLLNPDAVIKPEDIRMLSESLHSSADIAAVAPAQRAAPTAEADRVRWPFPTPVQAWREALGLRHRPDDEGFVIGSVLLLRGDALVDIGGFDERFFLYAEETDWQKRAQRRGWRTVCCTGASAIHEGGGTDRDPTRRELRFHAGGERYIRKWYAGPGWQMYRSGVVFGALLRAASRRGPDRRAALRRARIYLAGPDRLALQAGVVPPSRPFIPGLLPPQGSPYPTT